MPEINDLCLTQVAKLLRHSWVVKQLAQRSSSVVWVFRVGGNPKIWDKIIFPLRAVAAQ